MSLLRVEQTRQRPGRLKARFLLSLPEKLIGNMAYDSNLLDAELRGATWQRCRTHFRN